MPKIIPAPRGARFGRLIVVREGIARWNGSVPRRTMVCRCDCGSSDVEVLFELLRNGKTRSCGCLRREATAANNGWQKKTHGMRRHPLYATWCGMRARCGNPANPAYRNYGGRGIRVHEPWQDFPVFVRDVEAEIGPRPDGHSLDRYPDNDGSYEPGNIRWSTPREQLLNRRAVPSLTARIAQLEEENRRLRAELGAMRMELDMAWSLSR